MRVHGGRIRREALIQLPGVIFSSFVVPKNKAQGYQNPPGSEMELAQDGFRVSKFACNVMIELCKDPTKYFKREKEIAER